MKVDVRKIKVGDLVVWKGILIFVPYKIEHMSNSATVAMVLYAYGRTMRHVMYRGDDYEILRSTDEKSKRK